MASDGQSEQLDSAFDYHGSIVTTYGSRYSDLSSPRDTVQTRVIKYAPRPRGPATIRVHGTQS